MRIFISLAWLLATICQVPMVLAAEATIEITAPAAGAKLSSTAKVEVAYKAAPGPNADHVRLYVDNHEPVHLPQMTGNHTLDPLPPGKHGICARLVNKEHVEIGIQDCVMFRVE